MPAPKHGGPERRGRPSFEATYDRESPYVVEGRARVTERSAKYIAESTMKSEASKHDLAWEAALLFETLDRIVFEKLAGTAKAEETRTITSIAGAYHRAMKELGVTAEHVDREEEAL